MVSKGVVMQKTCLICGKDIKDRTSHNVKYCSPKCSRIADSEKAISKISNRAVRINKVAHLVYSAYECKCALCGWQATPDLIKVGRNIQYAHGNEIHHIKPISKGGTDTPDNLILLCPNHHKQADLGLIDVTTLQAHTKDFIIDANTKKEVQGKCIDKISSLLFNDT
jgi:predicted restriction endonuclease